jgi:hypothetical protein
MTLDELRRCRLLFIDGVWKLKLPDGTLQDATPLEVKALFPKQLTEDDDDTVRR